MLPLNFRSAINHIIAYGRTLMRMDEAGIAFLIGFEGFSGTRYDDGGQGVGNCTIGYGYKIHDGPCDGRDSEQPWLAGITEEQGRTLLHETLKTYEAAVDTTAIALNQNQYNAMVDATYNLGQGWYINEMRIVVNAGGDVRDALMRYVHDNDGNVLPGLVRRRKAEGDLYYTEDEDAMTPELKATLDALYNALIDQGKRLGQLQVALPALAVANAESFKKIEDRLTALESK